ncbi:unnamed protein product [Spodoptera littoralis]|uniref:Uncharacterized protein n=1 Tax=Spodoptera littoralis TaxID=7109 RepID=A0A9P0I2E6_SPOLI|nr:unnamed protein product [Spodoptera littoralis]CAH1640015.1 unnamed protein product [Spodoptera littoralis]
MKLPDRTQVIFMCVCESCMYYFVYIFCSCFSSLRTYSNGIVQYALTCDLKYNLNPACYWLIFNKDLIIETRLKG